MLKKTGYILILLVFGLSSVALALDDKILPPDNEDAKNKVIEFINNHQIESDSCYYDLYSTVYKWIGTKYRYSGTGGKNGFDCSGFAKMVYKTVFNQELNGSSADIFRNTKALDANQLEIGDLVFFKIRGGKISHVGIYLGNNKFAHAAVKGGVRIDSLDFPYYKRTFYKGGRL